MGGGMGGGRGGARAGLGPGSARGGQRWDVQMTKVSVDGSELLVCAVGGSTEQRKRQIARGAAGAVRILAA